MVWQVEFGEYGVDLGVVLACLAENVDHFAARVLGVVGPVGDLDYGFVAGDAAFELGAGDEYVGGQEFGVGEQICEVLFDLQGADEFLVDFLDYLHHFGLGFGASAVCGYVDPHFVAVEGMHRVTLGHEY